MDRPSKSLARKFPRPYYSPSEASQELQGLLGAENSEALVENTLRYADIEEILSLYPYHFDLLEQPTMLIGLAKRFGLTLSPSPTFKDLLEAYDRTYFTVRSYLYPNRTTAQILKEACRLGHLEAVEEGLKVAKMFLTRPRTRLDYRQALDAALLGAAEGGHLDIARRLRTLKPPHPFPALVAATKARHVDLRNWLVTWIETDPQVRKLKGEDYFDLMAAALETGQDTLYDRLREKQRSLGGQNDYLLVLKAAARRGLIDVFRGLPGMLWAINSRTAPVLFKAAIKGRQLEMFQYLEQRQPIRPWTINVYLRLAVRHGAHDIADYLIAISHNSPSLLKGQKNFEEAMRLVYSDEPVLWEEHSEEVITQAANLAAREGRLEVLAQLLPSTPDRSELWRAAALKGQLKVLKFLIRELPEEPLPIEVLRILKDQTSPAEPSLFYPALVWLLEEVYTGRLQINQPLDDIVYLRLAIDFNDADLLELILSHREVNSFEKKGQDYPNPFANPEVSEGILEVLLNHGFREHLPEDWPLNLVRDDNLPALLYLTERKVLSNQQPLDLLNYTLAKAYSSKVLDHLLDQGLIEGLTVKETVRRIETASEYLAGTSKGRHSFLIHFLKRVIMETPHHPLPILDSIAQTQDMELMRLLLKYPGYDEIDAFLSWIDVAITQATTMSDETIYWLEELDEDKLLTKVLEKEWDPKSDAPRWLYNSMTGFMPDFQEKLDARIEEYMKTNNNPKLSLALSLKRGLLSDEQAVAFLDYCEELLKTTNTEEVRAVIREQWLAAGKKIAQRLRDPRMAPNIALMRRLLEGGLEIEKLPLSSTSLNLSLELLELRKEYDPEWPVFVTKVLQRPPRTEVLRGLILLGVDPQRIINSAVDQGKVKILRELVDEGLIEEASVDWELAKANVFSAARRRSDQQTSYLGRDTQFARPPRTRGPPRG